MRQWLCLCALLFVAHPVAFSQSSLTRIAGVVEPPELTGEPKKVKKPTEIQRQFAEIIFELNDQDKAKAARPKLNKFISDHSDYSDAYFMRALCDVCILDSGDYASALKDVETAIATHTLFASETIYDKPTDHYSLRGKIKLQIGQYGEAVDDLETAMKVDLDSADKIFNVSGIAPEKTSKPCEWNLTDLDTLVAKFPKDYRPLLFRGLYFKFFTTFKEDYYEKAAQEFQKAAALNPKSPLPHYFMGNLYITASFWTKKAWSSDEGRDAAYRNAIEASTKAIQLDPNLLPAYELSASAYHGLKQYRRAINDHDKALELDPENTTAYADRGLNKLELGEYLSAISDLGAAIRRKKDDDFSLSNSYGYRADAYVKIGSYREAIADYSKVIERRLANDTFLLSLPQIRWIYPEYDNVSDEMLCRKIHALFWPEFEYKVFAKRLMEENGKWEIGLLHELYEKRGDAYLRAGDFHRGVLDFKRIFKGIPNFADTVDRWRLLGAAASGEEHYLDVKSVEAFDGGPARLWLKSVSSNKNYTIRSYEIDCTTRRISLTSTVAYTANNQILNSSELSSGWQRIIPESIGETLYNGLCSTFR